METGIIVSADSPFHTRGNPARINGKESKVLDFWKWAYSILNDNTNRGILGQYIVAWALGVDNTVQITWQAYDLLAPNNKKIEVKTTAKVQTWDPPVNSNSQPQFRIVPTRASTYENVYAKAKTFNADIYVLCYYSWEDRKTMDATNLDHWKFWVFSVKQLKEVLNGKQSVPVSKLEQYHQSVDAFKLKDTILSL